jgi:signal transduction histidine kinase/CheY-like chemotaxis protein/HPt (histidine-containing phosphotransfer) domain-containing protein
MNTRSKPQADVKPVKNGTLYLLFAVFIVALLLVLGLKAAFSDIYDELAARSANERARLFIGEEIVRGIHGVEKDIYRMAATTNSAAVRRINQDVTTQLNKLNHDLKVLKEGGSVKREILLNIEGRDEMVREVEYHPDPSDQGYVMELIEISPQLDQVQVKIDELGKMLILRWEYREKEDRARFFIVEQEIATFLKHIPPFFLRLDENANRLFFDSSERLRSLESELDQQRRRFKIMELSLVGVVVSLALLAGFMVMRRINESNRRLEDALEHMKTAKDEAERASRAKSEFVSRMSHELRTPLNAIIGFAELLEAEPLQPSHQNYVGLINRSGHHLMELINQVLDHAKIESGKLTIEHIPFDFRATIDEVAAIVSARASSKGLLFVAAIAHNLPTYVMGDPTRLRQILINLLVNAVKFTEKGSVELRIAPEGERIVFSIRDTGIGMEQATLGRLFQAFGQADDSITRKYGGTGLGLLISRELVQAMGGDIEVDSAPGVGSCFWFSLPLQQAEKVDSDAFPMTDAPDETSLATLVAGRLLLVDDNRVNQQLASAMLRKFGLEHDIASNGAEALDMMASTRYAVVLMDMEMPEMDGLTATRHWREREANTGTAPLPIIAMTANAMQEDKQKCFDVGMNGYVAKPISLAALEGELRRILHRRKTSSESTDATANMTPEGTGFNRAEALALIGDDEELFAEIAGIFVADAPGYLTDMQDALIQSDWSRLSRIAHTLKGLCATFSAPHAEADARRLEEAANGKDAEVCSRLAVIVAHQTEAMVNALKANA